MKTMVGSGIVAALMMMTPAGAALAEGTASADGYSALNDQSTALGGDQTSPAMASAEEMGSVEEEGAGGGEPGRMSATTHDDSARAQDLAHEAWLNSIWYGP